MRKIKKVNEVYERTSLSEQNTIDLGVQIGNLINPGICILFFGELGSGKTVFIRGICEALGIEKKLVKSPSFTLVHEYKGVHPVAHVDLYRLEGDTNAIKSLSLDEYIDEGFILLVEWAENGDFDMDEILRIKIEPQSDNIDTRKLTFSAEGANAKYVLQEFLRMER
jgi:tRNA threonylcarbamoyladenosine biosynthesis protein TsaE